MLKIDASDLRCCTENFSKYEPKNVGNISKYSQNSPRKINSIDIASLARKASIDSGLSDVGSSLGKIVLDSARVSYRLQQIENKAIVAELSSYKDIENPSEFGNYLANLAAASMKIDTSRAILAQSGLSVERISALLV
ncbi:MAG: hypothetical protein LDL13_02155 [Calditerrivibrio sp.]|nr:hypothetical protein [Calditerrivibrio sp.]MCA1932365.1 hypothetical protein [Calditerrivibrio sp.]